MSRLFIFGFGFTSEAIAKACENQFEQFYGTTRSYDKYSKLEIAGVKPVLYDGGSLSNEAYGELATSSHILISIAPNEEGDVVLNHCRGALKENKNLKWIGYLSTVGVYGNHDGAWVDEETECKPVSKRSLQRVDAESKWQSFAEELNVPLAIFRLSGIYGPGRNTFINIEKGKARRLVKKDQVFNRIHREDIGSAVSLAIQKDIAGIFNITDDEPAPPQDVVSYAHELMEKNPPQEIEFETADLTPMARSFYGENKRVSNAKSKQVLGFQYKWPNYRESLTRMWEDGSWKT